ncbi:MAG: hypothetical protein KHW80_12980 [Faecalibacterium sp.]|nr:hypothetical protein [Faecalibacterium sp.]
MDMYDERGNPVTDYDPAKGRLEMQKRIHHHEAVEAVEEQGHWETVVEYPETGGRDVQWVVDVPGVEAQEAWDEEETYWLYIPYTEEELAQMEADRNQPTPEERVKELEEALELLLSGATEVTEDEGGTAGEDTGL